MDTAALMDKYAELAVRVGVNVEAGQNVIVEGYVEHAPFVRRLVEAAYKAGARHVEADYDDQHVRKSFIEHAEPDVLSWTPPYLLKKWADIVDGRVAMIFIAGDPDPNLLAGLDPDRVGSARPLELIEYRTRELGRRAFSWTIVAYQPRDGPTPRSGIRMSTGCGTRSRGRAAFTRTIR